MPEEESLRVPDEERLTRAISIGEKILGVPKPHSGDGDEPGWWRDMAMALIDHIEPRWDLK